MNLRCLSTCLAAFLFLTATVAEAAVHRVFPGESIQAAINAASPGDTILVEPGIYNGTEARYGLRIQTDNLRLIGKSKKGQKVRLIQTGAQETGIYAGPPGCEYDDPQGSCPDTLYDFYVRGFSVEEFPRNGIQTRWVEGFKFIRNTSVNNLNNGIYPTLSANGLVANNISYGSGDTAMWASGVENVRIIGNDVSKSVIGFEITVSNNVVATHNRIHDNTVGVGLFHPNAAGNPQLPEMKNWFIARNDIFDNNNTNLPNPAPPGSFQEGVPPGVGILMLGVSDHTLLGNEVSDNDYVGIAVLGWCTAVATGPPNRNCINDPPQADPSTNNNVVAKNKMSNNGTNPPPGPLAGLAADITYFSLIEANSGNCFEKNKPKNGFTFVSSEPDGLLPTDGC